MALTPSQRITLMKSIAQRLGHEDWSLIDLTLKQFALPWAEQWSGSSEAYVLEMIERAGDDVLLDLGRHVGFQLHGPAQRVDPPFWRKGMFRLFVTHLAAQRALAGELQEALLPFGISAFVAHNDIAPTQEWQTQIETALATCDAVVALLHPHFHESNWTDQEVGFGMGRGVPVFSVRFGEDPYGFIGRFQAFQGEGKSAAQLARELFEAYRKNKETQAKMAEILIGLLEESSSFAGAKTNMDYLEELEVWDRSFSARLQAAIKNNSQVEGAWGVPDRIRRLVTKWAERGV